jgi:organic radical activating enzyme
MKKEQIEQLTEEGKMLPLMEEFYTIQGEGFHKGAAAYFIRIGGCDVGCHWCDVKESWDAEKHPPKVTERIADNALRHSKLVVITGGEPLTWNMEPLTRNLKEGGAQIHIETSGAYKMTGTWDWICLSPKKIKLPQAEIYPIANELKCIIFNKHDFKFAEQQAEKVSGNCHLYLQPEWSKRDKMMPLIVDYVKQNPKWRVSLQSHKYLEVP